MCVSHVVPLLLWILALVSSCGSPSDARSSRPAGDFRTAYVGEPWVLGAPLAAAAVAAAIARDAPGRADPVLSDAALAARLVAVSACFGLDSAVVTALVRQESAFRRTAVSATGASGLTQLTSIGVQEVNDQLGQRGVRYARRAATRYFTTQVRGCLAPGFGRGAWPPLWRRVGGGPQAMRDELRVNADDALLYGAVLLKTELSVVRTLGGPLDAEAAYAAALERYNGDPNPATRASYRRGILRYAAELRGR